MLLFDNISNITMAGGLIQLVAYGVQDIYLTAHPQITFFKVLYRRHTNFSIESLAQNFNSTANFGETVSCTISRAGDLIGKILLYIELPAIPKFINKQTGEEDFHKKIAWVNNLGYALIQEISIEIGGKVIDKQYGEWMYLWSQVNNKQDHTLNKMIGNVPKIYEFTNGKPGYQLYIPLEFWFCRNLGLAIPLVSLSSDDVKIIVTFRKLLECYRIGPTHSIEILENIAPFKPGDFIEQTVNKQTIYGYVTDFDYLEKKLYYIKIQNTNAIKKTFESYQENPITDAKIYKLSGFNPVPIYTTQSQMQYPNQLSNISDQHQLSNANQYQSNIPKKIINSLDYSANKPYRIYNSLTQAYVTPRPNSRELIEQTNLSDKPQFVNAFLYVDYVYLDSEERNKFVRTNHEYLIEQIQFNQELGIKSPNIKQKLAINHPTKAIYWVAQLDNLVGPNTINDLFNYTTSHIHYASSDPNADSLPEPVPNYHIDICPTINSKLDKQERFYGTNLVSSGNIILNGRNRFSNRSSQYFNLIEPYQHHFRGPNPGINMYSFSLYADQYQPSSTVNMSKIDEVALQLRLDNTVNMVNTVKIRSYAVNYNILRIYFGLGGLAFEYKDEIN